MDNLDFTAQLYGRDHFQHSVDDLHLPEGFVKYHKGNFLRYFDLSAERIVGCRALETGCGPGKHAIVLALLGCDVMAVDLSSDNVERGQRLKEFYNLENLHFQQYDLMSKLNVERPFDLISAHNWVQHAENPSVILRNLVSVLRKGGRIYLSLYHGQTFRFFITQIARSILRREYYGVMRNLVKYHFPLGLREFRNPDDIYFENIFDDFFVPYCHTTTYSIVMHDMASLGCRAVTGKPEIENIYGIDNIPLRMGFEKVEDVREPGELQFTKPIDEFVQPVPGCMLKSIELARKVIGYYQEKEDSIATSSFCLGLYRLRGMMCGHTNTEEKHQLLQSYLELNLSAGEGRLSAFSDTQGLYKSSSR